MIDSEKYAKTVNEYFDFLTTEFQFIQFEKDVRGNYFYDLRYKDVTRVISISYENMEDYFLVLVYLLQDGKMPRYDDPRRRLSLNKLNELLVSGISKNEFSLNNQFFAKFHPQKDIEQKIFKAAKELRLCLNHFEDIQKLHGLF